MKRTVISNLKPVGLQLIFVAGTSYTAKNHENAICQAAITALDSILRWSSTK